MRWGYALPIIVALATPGAWAAAPVSAVDAYVQAHQKEIVGQLDSMVRIESVAANPDGLTRQAAKLEGELRRRGFAARQIVEGGPPLVFGELKARGARRTVIFYAHYDGQPVTPSQWASPPFDPVMRSGPLSARPSDIDWRATKALDPEWRLFGRATSDDKAGIVAFLAAFDALKASGQRPKVNIKVVWEGEEEAGSPHLRALLNANKALFAGDVWMIGDGPAHQSRRRTLYFGARGMMGLEATVYGPLSPLHDGHYGNWVRNPAAMAAELIASLRAPDGNIMIPGYSDDVRPLAAPERAAIAALPPIEDGLKRQFGIGGSEGSEGLTMSTMRPSINIRGLSAGKVGDSATNSIPADAQISIDFRLVPDETPEHIRAKVERYLTEQGWTIVSAAPDMAARLAHPRIVRLDWEGGYPALRADMAIPVARAAAKAMGKDVALLPMMGGSVPIYLFEDVLHTPVIGLPLANHDNSQHAANENLRLGNLWDGIASYAAMMTRLDW